MQGSHASKDPGSQGSKVSGIVSAWMKSMKNSRQGMPDASKANNLARGLRCCAHQERSRDEWNERAFSEARVWVQIPLRLPFTAKNVIHRPLAGYPEESLSAPRGVWLRPFTQVIKQGACRISALSGLTRRAADAQHPPSAMATSRNPPAVHLSRELVRFHPRTILAKFAAKSGVPVAVIAAVGSNPTPGRYLSSTFTV